MINDNRGMIIMVENVNPQGQLLLYPMEYQFSGRTVLFDRRSKIFIAFLENFLWFVLSLFWWSLSASFLAALFLVVSRCDFAILLWVDSMI